MKPQTKEKDVRGEPIDLRRLHAGRLRARLGRSRPLRRGREAVALGDRRAQEVDRRGGGPCMQIAKAARFKGVYSAEFAGAGDPYAGTQKIVDAVVKNL